MENFRSSQEDDEVGLVPFAGRVELTSFLESAPTPTTVDYEQDEQEQLESGYVSEMKVKLLPKSCSSKYVINLAAKK